MNINGSAWTDARVEALTQLWGAGLSASQIAGELGSGFSRNSIISKAHRIGLDARGHDSIWTTEKVEELRTLWAGNPSVSDISAELGLTRGQVISKAFRLGLSERSTMPATPRKRRRRGDSGGGAMQTIKSKHGPGPGANARRTPGHRLSAAPITLPQGPFKVELGLVDNMRAVAPVRRTKPVVRKGPTLLDLGQNHCRWPVGTPGDPAFFFCGLPGADVDHHRPYCGGNICRRFMTTTGEGWQ